MVRKDPNLLRSEAMMGNRNAAKKSQPIDVPLEPAGMKGHNHVTREIFTTEGVCPGCDAIWENMMTRETADMLNRQGMSREVGE